MDKWIQVIILLAGIFFIKALLPDISKQEDICTNSERSYIVDFPAAFGQLCLMITGGGGIAFCIFAFLYDRKLGEVSQGHLVLSAIFALIGMVGIFVKSRWRVVVQGEQICFYNILKPRIKIRIKEIEKVQIGRKDELRIYFSGKKIKTIDRLTNNYENFLVTLLENNVEIYRLEE